MDCPSSRNASSLSGTVAHRALLIQKVPQSVRGGLEKEKRYFVPDLVSIGPYHHRADDHLLEMEKVKEAVAREFCNGASGPQGLAGGQQQPAAEQQFLQAVAAVRPLVEEAKRCYADSFDSLFTDSEFANMMVVDGCFLLAVMAVLTEDYPYEHGWWTHGRMLRIMKDILLFENQIPWAVLDRLMALRSVKVESFVADIILAYFDLDGHNREPPSSTQHHSPPLSTQHQSPEHRNGESPFLTPPESPEHRLEAVHLLDLVHQRYLGRGRAPDAGGGAVRYCNYARAFAPFTSAVELAEAGIHLQGSGTCRVTDVRVEEDLPAAAMARLSIGRLVLPRLALSWLPRCWLINMVALECVTDRSDNSGVSSYLAILGSLVRAERDVEELRARRILFSTMSDRRTVEFFEGILDPLPRQELYLKTLEGIVQLRARRSTRSGIHAFLYKNRKIIFALAPLLSLLVAIVGLVVNNSIKHKY